jgi:chromosome segregation ATPase
MTSHDRKDADEIFLSPRVIDREAFDDYAVALREIIEDAQRLGDSLTRQTAQARSAVEEFARSEPALAAKAEGVSRTLATVDERITALRGLIERAEAQTRELGDFDERAGDLIEQRLKTFSASVQEIVAQAESRLSATAVETTTRVNDAAGEAEAMIARTRDEALESVGTGAKRLETLSESLGGELADNAAEAREQLRQTLADLEDRAEPARREMERSISELEDRLDRLRKQTLALMGPGVRELEHVCERGARLLGRDPGTDETPDAGSLTEVTQRLERGLERARDETKSALERFNNLREAAEASGSSLSERILESAQWMDRLSEHHASLEEGLARNLDRCREVEAAMKSREADLRAALVEPRRRIEADLASVMELRTHLSAAREEMESLLERHGEAAKSVSDESQRLEALLARATKAVRPENTADPTPERSDPPGNLAEELARMAAAIESLGRTREAGTTPGASAIETKPAANGTPKCANDASARSTGRTQPTKKKQSKSRKKVSARTSKPRRGSAR